MALILMSYGKRGNIRNGAGTLSRNYSDSRPPRVNHGVMCSECRKKTLATFEPT